LNYDQIEKIFSILNANEEALKNLKTVGCKYNGFSSYGPYEDESLNDNRLFTIDGDGTIIVHNNGKITTNTLTFYISGNSTDRDYSINKNQLYTLALIIEIFKKKVSPNVYFVVSADLLQDFNEADLDIYRKSIADLLVEIK